MLADAGAAVFGKRADLGDVSDIGADTGAEQDSDAGAGRAVDGDERGGGSKTPQPGKRTMLLRKGAIRRRCGTGR